MTTACSIAAGIPRQLSCGAPQLVRQLRQLCEPFVIHHPGHSLTGAFSGVLSIVRLADPESASSLPSLLPTEAPGTSGLHIMIAALLLDPTFTTRLAFRHA